ncbi:protein FRA10AC1 homolog [Daktulosphaira vitifoliae]|uniref:protein FRA10AC1 homolog n=1 Tax=Daktulosphaira vitifoliae TaxID=58002 RepID=UPI0021AAC2FA|nr:protein FRA10AC1 homolog [Daktulosphaira vitifoliae]
MYMEQLSNLQPYELHKKLLDQYLSFCKRRDAQKNEKRDIDVIQENHKFVWEDDDEIVTWEQKLAKKYYDKLFKEYCICDLSLYKKSKVAMRWQIEKEMISGKGQFICGNKICNESNHLRTWEVNFGYMEHGEKKNTLVKLRLCPDCSNKLNYKQKRKEIKRKVFKSTRNKFSEKSVKDNDIIIYQIPTSSNTQSIPSNVNENNVWSEQIQVEDEKPREDDFEDYLEQLFF